MRTAVALALKLWKDPQGDVILIHGEHECSVYFLCWSSAGVPADYIGHLSFKGVSAVRSYPREFLPYAVTPGEKPCILKVEDSDLALEYADYRKLHYPHFPLKEMTHFVVWGHDIYHEILAISFEALTIQKGQIRDSTLLRLIADE